MNTQRQLLLAVGSVLATLNHVDGFVQPARIQRSAVSSSSRKQHQQPLKALFMEDTDRDDDDYQHSRDAAMNNRHSASDWLYNMFSLPRSSVLRDIRNPVMTIAVWSGIVSVFQKLLASSQSNVLQSIATNMCVGSTPHSFLVSSLGLLLVFRTNSAYQRFYVSTVLVVAVVVASGALVSFLGDNDDSRLIVLTYSLFHRKDAKFGRIFIPYPEIFRDSFLCMRRIWAQSEKVA